MARAIAFEIPADTSTFSAIQLQPRVAASLTWNALARWLRAYLFSFPALIRDERTGLVVLGFQLEYGAPTSFFECDTVRVRAAMRVLAAGAKALLDARFATTTGTLIASSRLILCPVAIEDPLSLAATPAPLSERLLGRFAADEIDPGTPPRTVPERRAALETVGTLLAEGRHPFVIHRHRSEVAEQWSWTEVPALVEEARELLALSQGDAQPALRRYLGQPLRRLDVEFGKPLFSFEPGVLVTRAYQRGAHPGLVHRLTSPDETILYATVVEGF